MKNVIFQTLRIRFIIIKKKKNCESLNYTFATDVVDDCYLGGNLIDVADVSGVRRTRTFQGCSKVYIVLRLLSRVTRNRTEWLHENFDRLQLCSFSQQQMFLPRGYARVYVARMYVPLSLMVIFLQLTEIPIRRTGNARIRLKKYNIFIQVR